MPRLRKVRSPDELGEHLDASLAGATCADSTVICHRHGYRFNLKTGDCLTIGGYGLPTFPVEIQGDEVIVSTWECD